MNVGEICRIGFFDKVIISVQVEPVCINDIELFGDCDFAACANSYGNSLDNSIMKVRLNILGVEDIHKQVITPDELTKRANRGANVFKDGGAHQKSYLLAYADLLVIMDVDRNKSAVLEAFKGESDKQRLASAAFSLQSRGANKVQSQANGFTRNHIAIVDRLYVFPAYRRCRISSWIHDNLREILFSYVNVAVGDILLIPGDFSNESAERFNMTPREYNSLLNKHYEKLGYKPFSENILINRVSKATLADNLRQLGINVKNKLAAMQ